MNEIIPLLNTVAEHWWQYVFHATWQFSLIAVVLLLVVWCCRRLPSPLRYALLLIALVKLAAPPMLAGPTGLFSRLGPVAQTDAAISSADPGAAPSRGAARGWGLGIHDTNREAIGPLVDSGVAGPGLAFDLDEATTTPAAGPAETAIGSPRIGWRTWLMFSHGLGCLAVGAWLVMHLVRLVRLARRAEQVTSGPLHEKLARLAAKQRLRRPVRLLVSAEAQAPMAFGLLRPVVLLPARAARELSSHEIGAVLAHELAHHKRWDSWVNWIQIAAAVVWWFNPLVWLVNGALRRAREDCCDDRILHDQLTTRTAYGETLLHLAQVLSRRACACRMLGYAQGMHPLRRRLLRVLDSKLRRAPRLSLAGCLAVLVLGGLVLPGVSMETDKPPQPEAAEPASGVPQAAEKPPVPEATVTLAGTVTDPKGNPLAGVRVRSYVGRLLPLKPIFDEAHTITDQEGRFRLAGLRRWERLNSRAPWDDTRGHRRLIFEHPDFAVALFDENDARVFKSGFDFEKIEVRLLRQTTFSGLVTDDEGQPVAGAVVTGEVQERREKDGRLENGESFRFGFWRRDAITTDAEGRFMIEQLPVLSLLDITVEHPRYATYNSRNEYRDSGDFRGYYPFYAGDHDLHVKLSLGATIEGRLIHDGKPLKQARERIEVRDASGQRPWFLWATTDDEGRYTLTGLSEGLYTVYARHWSLTEAGLVSTPVFEVRGEAGATTRDVNLVCTEGRVLVGRVTDRANGRPLEGCHVAARLGKDLEIWVDSADTDAEGRYRLRVPPGDYLIQTSEWRDGKTEEVAKEVHVPAEGPLPDVDLALGTRPEHPGRLVDENRRPVAGSVVVAGDWRPIETAEDGTFRVPAPWGYPKEKRWVSGYAFNRDKTLGASFWWIPRDRAPAREIVLRPVATVRGRVVKSGKPVGDARAWIKPVDDARAWIKPVDDARAWIWQSIPYPLFSLPSLDYLSSLGHAPYDLTMRADGTFQFSRVVIPETSLMMLHVQYSADRNLRWYKAEVTLYGLKPGETLDLGDIVLPTR